MFTFAINIYHALHVHGPVGEHLLYQWISFDAINKWPMIGQTSSNHSSER